MSSNLALQIKDLVKFIMGVDNESIFIYFKVTEVQNIIDKLAPD